MPVRSSVVPLIHVTVIPHVLVVAIRWQTEVCLSESASFIVIYDSLSIISIVFSGCSGSLLENSLDPSHYGSFRNYLNLGLECGEDLPDDWLAGDGAR